MAAQRVQEYEQLDLFGENEESEAEQANLEREKSRQNAILSVKKKFGKNAILKGIDLEKDATAKQRNDQIGGHRA